MIVTIIHNRKSYEYSIEYPEVTTILDLKKLFAKQLYCYPNNLRFIYSDVNQHDYFPLSEYHKNNLTLLAAIIPIACQNVKHKT